MLQKFETSMIATRGANVLSTLLSERKRMPQPYSGRKRRRSDNESSDGGGRKRRLLDLSGVFESLDTNQKKSSEMLEGDSESDEEPDLTYKRFAELFPPQAGFSNNFLFRDLLDFER